MRQQEGDFEPADDEVEPKKKWKRCSIGKNREEMFGMFQSRMEKQFALREKELKLQEREMGDRDGKREA